MNELLKVENIKKIYQTQFKGMPVEALRSIDLSVDKGDYVAIMGESGSGKSTLLNLIATLDKPSSGTILLDGMDLNTIKEKNAAAFRRDHLGLSLIHI